MVMSQQKAKKRENRQDEDAAKKQAAEVAHRFGLIAAVIRETASKPHGVFRLADCLIAYGSRGYALDRREQETVEVFKKWATIYGCEILGFGTDAKSGGSAWVLSLGFPPGLPGRDEDQDYLECFEDALDCTWKIACHNAAQAADRVREKRVPE